MNNVYCKDTLKEWKLAGASDNDAFNAALQKGKTLERERSIRAWVTGSLKVVFFISVFVFSFVVISSYIGPKMKELKAQADTVKLEKQQGPTV